ncbi:MAG: kynurenine 3-monooxygenase [Bradymonadia bacterium]|jgi:kynurenine 3-monooxygenase
MTDSLPIVIAGAGLAGSLIAVSLAKQGFKVLVLERRPDLRTAEIPAGRSINLALSARGLAALNNVDLADEVLDFALAMHGRMMHSQTGDLTYQAYGRDGEAIQSVSRRALNELLMSEAEKHGAELRFGQRVSNIDVDGGIVSVKSANGEQDITARLIIGADGAFSAVRGRMQRLDRFDFAQTYIEHGYKELTIPPTEDGGFRIDKDKLHIWPREDFMLIALPNPDATFTCTLFLGFEGTNSFENLPDAAAGRAFFEREFPDVLAHLPNFDEEFEQNPTSSLVYTSCDPYHVGKKTVLVGDAAHAIVPFYGQGMNAAFEDCLVLDGLIKQHGPDDGTAISEFTRLRKPNGDAIRDLALYNFVVMRSRVADERFLARRKLETTLEGVFTETFRSLYGMVTFSTIPYAEARDIADRQTAFLDEDERSGGSASLGLLVLAYVKRLVG